METYLNRGGDSGVSQYSISDTAIRVKFKSSSKVYVYSHSRPGQTHVDRMKQLAVSGRGLQSYINQHKSAGYDSTEY